MTLAVSAKALQPFLLPGWASFSVVSGTSSLCHMAQLATRYAVAKDCTLNCKKQSSIFSHHFAPANMQQAGTQINDGQLQILTPVLENSQLHWLMHNDCVAQHMIC